MKVRRAFKSYPFWTPKKKEAERLNMKLSSNYNISGQRSVNLIFQNQHPISMLAPLYHRIFQPTGQGKQIDKTFSADYHLIPSRLTWSKHRLMFL